MNRSVAIATQLGLASTIALATIVGCGSGAPSEKNESTSSALGSCGPTEKPVGDGGCQICPALTTPASISAYQLAGLFLGAGVAGASYSITNDVGTFNVGVSKLGQFGFAAPPSTPINIAPITGSFDVVSGIGPSVSYTAYPSIPSMSMTWGNWTVGSNGVTIPATLSGSIDVHVSTGVGVVNPVIQVNGLPISVTFGSDSNGFATVASSGVAVGPVGNYSSISGCGAFGWCDGVISGQVDSGMQSALQTQIAGQFASALNPKNDAGVPVAFWPGLLTDVANNAALNVLTDPAGNPLPKDGVAQPGGTTSSWTCTGGVGFNSTGLTANFQSSAGLCFLDCIPKTAQELCSQPNACAQMNDGCGDIVQCPGLCSAPGDTCWENECQACTPKTCAAAGRECGLLDTGCGYSIECGTCPSTAVCNTAGTCVANSGGGGGTGGKGCFGHICM